MYNHKSVNALSLTSVGLVSIRDCMSSLCPTAGLPGKQFQGLEVLKCMLAFLCNNHGLIRHCTILIQRGYITHNPQVFEMFDLLLRSESGLRAFAFVHL